MDYKQYFNENPELVAKMQRIHDQFMDGEGVQCDKCDETAEPSTHGLLITELDGVQVLCYRCCLKYKVNRDITKQN